jgi:hypothetical protein
MTVPTRPTRNTMHGHRMRRGTTILAAGILAVGGVSVLAACSSGGSAGSSTAATPTSTSSASPTGAQVIAPVFVAPGQTQATVTLGNVVVFNVEDPTKVMIATDNPEILAVTPGRDDGSAVFNPGAEPLAPGTATVTLTNMDTGAVQTVSITVTQ